MVNRLKLMSGQDKEQSSFQDLEPQLKDVSLSNPLDRVTYLYRILARTPVDAGGRRAVTRFLEAGCRMFNAQCGLVLHRLSQQVGEVTAFWGGEDSFYVGQHLPIEGTPAQDLFSKNETCAIENLQSAGVSSASFAYTSYAVNAYLGTRIPASSGEKSILCFVSSVPREQGYSAEDLASLELLAEGVACMINQQHAHAQRKLTDQAMFAMGSVKTLDEYLQQARLPEVYGVPARVVEVLQRRIGQAPLSIGHVAEELNLSKRTLQRRLQQQDVSFAELRDQLRFHYSIDYLIKQHMSIDAISASLDFSDRTSFTNAFKRWTGLSPSTFRKLFRDYV
jgi:AraC-like DNA-binding protein